MKLLKKITLILAIAFITLIMGNITKAYTLQINDVSAKKGEEFTVNISVDENTGIANGYIVFDTSKIEFVRTNQDGLEAAVQEDGGVSWVYINQDFMTTAVDENTDTTSLGTQNFEFTFKVKENGASEMSFENMAFVGVNDNEYSMDDISGNTKININKKSKTWLVIVIVIVVLLILIILGSKKKKSKK